mmetsp:Transcript_18747/g.33037  ORF Transcript_18747/g.33037 Transcript_18747/m.33037 type:complete len:106 (-) Transcript_18747:53-370(-)
MSTTETTTSKKEIGASWLDALSSDEIALSLGLLIEGIERSSLELSRSFPYFLYFLTTSISKDGKSLIFVSARSHFFLDSQHSQHVHAKRNHHLQIYQCQVNLEIV